ncbi:TIGR02217 family protein [Mesorhizobium sp. IMUNJ 23232]|uniref:phage distal tail protein, Rcc01695 family n=1 Tax=Mesorhizobium sp. IMUNJ 23232 TaxID=3376064 RepID=UPI0037914DE2
MTELSAFHDVRFPTAVSFGATGGPERRNEIVTLTSGREKRNARFAHSRHRYDAGTGLRSLADLYEIVDFFEARRGSLHAFRFRDPFDMKSCRADQIPTDTDQVLGTGDGARTRFALVKSYGDGESAYARPIRKPVSVSLMVAVGGMPAATPADYAFDDATGEIVFSPSAVPGVDEEVTAGFEFDVPVRFDIDRLEIGISAFKAGAIPSIPLVEVRL